MMAVGRGASYLTTRKVGDLDSVLEHARVALTRIRTHETTTAAKTFVHPAGASYLTFAPRLVLMLNLTRMPKNARIVIS